MQSFEALFRQSWERSRELKLSGCILLNWVLLIVLAAVFAAAAYGAYYVFIEKKQAAQSIVNVNPELRRIFAPKRALMLNDARLTFGTRDGDKLGKVVIRTPTREIRAKSAGLRINVEKSIINLTLRRYRIYEIVDGKIGADPVTGDDWGSLELSYPFELPDAVTVPERQNPGDFARGLAIIFCIVSVGAALWWWIWRMLAAGVARETLHPGPTRLLRIWREGFARWRTVMYPVPLLMGCGIVSFVGSLPNVLQLPLPFFLAIYPLACALEVTLLIFSGIMIVGAAVNPPDISFGSLLRESVRVFLNGWGRYLFGAFWLYAFFALFFVMLAPALLPLIDAVVFGGRVFMVIAVVWILLWLIGFIATGVRVRGCIAAYQMYLYMDAVSESHRPETGTATAAENSESGVK